MLGGFMNDLKPLQPLLPEVDYQALMAQLHGFSHPRRKLQELERKKLLIRLKRGFYVLSREVNGKDHSLPIAANLLYGPSYLSLEFALSYYGLIPERVEALTSVTTQKNKSFSTPLGLFTYRHLSPRIYPLGVTFAPTEDGRTYLIASPEKALLDVFTLSFDGKRKPTRRDLESALFDDLRVDVEALKQRRNKALVEEMRPHYKNRRWCRLLLDFLLEEP